MEDIRELLRKEVKFDLRGHEVDRLLALMREVSFAQGEPIVRVGEVNRNVYVVKEGIIRYVDTAGDRERTFAFGVAGTLFMSMASFWKGEPSCYCIEACCDSVMLVADRCDFWNLIDSDHDVARWILSIAYEELWFLEHVNSNVHKGRAVERFLALWRQRPEIIRRVPQKIIASYLNITPEYLSRIKNDAVRGKFS